MPIDIVGCHPIYEGEWQLIRVNGLEAFWALDWGPWVTCSKG